MNSNGKINQIYSKIHSVYIKSKDKSEKQRELRVLIEKQITSGPLSRQALTILVTDDDDPYFLFSLTINEEDFKSLKEDQGLFIDFDDFPAQLIKLLDYCTNTNDRTTSRFNLLINEDQGMKHNTLQFVETNEFKHLCHLSLRIVPGNDNEIKKLMAQKVKKLQDELDKTKSLLEEKNQMLKVACEKLESKNHEFDEIKVKTGEEKSLIERKLLQEISEVKDSLAQAHLDWQRKVERSKHEVEERKNIEIKHLNEQLTLNRSKIEILTKKLLDAESNIRELSQGVEKFRSDNKKLECDNYSLRAKYTELDKLYHQTEKITTQQKSEISVLKEKLNSKYDLINRHQELLQVANEQKVKLEELIAEKSDSIASRDKVIKILKENEEALNAQLQEKAEFIKNYKTDIKKGIEVAQKQEECIKNQKERIEELNKRCFDCEQKCIQFEEDKKESDIKCNNMKMELDKVKDELTKCTNVLSLYRNPKFQPLNKSQFTSTPQNPAIFPNSAMMMGTSPVYPINYEPSKGRLIKSNTLGDLITPNKPYSSPVTDTEAELVRSLQSLGQKPSRHIPTTTTPAFRNRDEIRKS